MLPTPTGCGLSWSGRWYVTCMGAAYRRKPWGINGLHALLVGIVVQHNGAVSDVGGRGGVLIESVVETQPPLLTDPPLKIPNPPH